MLIDSITEKTTLDKKATVAIGNQLREGSEYRKLFLEQSSLVDSLIKENALRAEKNREYRDVSIPSLHRIIKEEKDKNSILEEKNELDRVFYKSKIKKKNGNFFKGLGIGAVLAFLFTVVFGG